MISQLHQENRRTCIARNRNKRCSNLEIDIDNPFYCEFERIVLNRAQHPPPPVFPKIKQQVIKKTNKKKRSIISKESSRTSSSNPSSHISEPEPIFDEDKIAELLELVQRMKIASKRNVVTEEISSLKEIRDE